MLGFTLGWKGGYCEVIGTDIAERPNTLVDIEVAVLDDSGLEAKLRTGPDFGCVHHEEKTPQQ